MIKYKLYGDSTTAYFDKRWKEAIIRTLEAQYGKHCLNKTIRREIGDYIAIQPEYAVVTLKGNDVYNEEVGKNMAKKKLLKRYYNALLYCHWIVYIYHNEKLKTVSATFYKQLDSIITKLDDYIFALKGVQKH